MADTKLDIENPNSHDDEKPVLTVDDWNKRWEERQIGFHQESVHELLEKHKESFINGRENIHVFFPLCGKAVDMKWLADMGHRVVGLDGSRMAIEEFFQEQNVKYTVLEVPGFGQLFKSEDGKISLYCGDLYEFNKNIEGDFDSIWDRGSFVAINPVDRQKYGELLSSLMAPECRNFINTLVYDQSKYAGPPHSSPLEAIQKAFGAYCDIKVIDSQEAFTEKHKSWGITSLIETEYTYISRLVDRVVGLGGSQMAIEEFFKARFQFCPLSLGVKL